MDIIDKNEFLREQLELIKRKQEDSTIEWQDVADFRSDYIGSLEHRDTVRKGAKLLLDYMDAGWVNEPENISFGAPSEKIALQKERYKIQTEKIELNKWVRELSRDELIAEKIVGAVNNLLPLSVPKYIAPQRDNKSYVCAFADPHYGIEFEIKDLFGNIINSYSPEIFEHRMWQLRDELLYIIDRQAISELNIWELGDGLQGIIRLNSQLMQLRYGIVESSIRYADFLASWLNDLSKYVRIKFQMVMDSNHNQLRICGAPKNAFGDENMSKVMIVLIKERLKDNPNVTIIENPTGMNYGIFSTYSTLGIHGEVKNLAASVNDYSRAYQTHIDYIFAAHNHHAFSKEVGIDCECYSIRSIIGVDPYGLSLNKTSNAGASLFEFEQRKGIICEHKIKLD